jgi:hypothetical protein
MGPLGHALEHTATHVGHIQVTRDLAGDSRVIEVSRLWLT